MVTKALDLDRESIAGAAGSDGSRFQNFRVTADRPWEKCNVEGKELERVCELMVTLVVTDGGTLGKLKISDEIGRAHV